MKTLVEKYYPYDQTAHAIYYAMAYQRYKAQQYMKKYGGTTTETPKTGNKNIGNKKMPKKFAKKGKRRGIVKKRIPRAITAKTKLIRCKATDYANLTCTSGALSRRTISGTNIVDPFASFGAGQPLGYDQWKALYNTAIVVGVKVRATVHNAASTSVMYGLSVCPRAQGETALTDYEHYKELPNTVSRLLSPDVDHGTIAIKSSTKRALGLKDLKDNEDVECLISADTGPTDQYYIHAWVQPTDQASTVGSPGIEFVFDVEYIVLLTNPIIPARSTA